MLSVGEVAEPSAGPDEIVIKTVAAGVNRADLMQRQGYYPPPPGASDTLGLEVSGTVAAIGEQVSGWSLGAPCVALLAGGGYAEYVVAPAGQVVAPPPGIDLVNAAGVIEVAATVLANLDQAGLSSDEIFLVHGGSGGIGSFAIQYAKALGTTVITTAGTQDKLDYCRSIGADHAISYRGDWSEEVKQAVDDHGVDVILDNMGAKYLDDHLQLLATEGHLMIIGMQGGAKGELNIGLLLSKRGSVTATSLRARPTREKAAICTRLVDVVWPLIGSGEIILPTPRRFPLADADQAHTRLESGDSQGKLILTL